MKPGDIALFQGDITRFAADAIVNAANSRLAGGGGVDGAIHSAGGPDIMRACRAWMAKEGILHTGRAMWTPAGNLPAKWVIHTVGPVYDPARAAACAQQLARAYESSLAVARELGARTVALPSISTGVYGYPEAEAAKIALAALRAYWTLHREHFDAVTMVLFQAETYEIYRRARDAL